MYDPCFWNKMISLYMWISLKYATRRSFVFNYFTKWFFFAACTCILARSNNFKCTAIKNYFLSLFLDLRHHIKKISNERCDAIKFVNEPFKTCLRVKPGVGILKIWKLKIDFFRSRNLKSVRYHVFSVFFCLAALQKRLAQKVLKVSGIWVFRPLFCFFNVFFEEDILRRPKKFRFVSLALTAGGNCFNLKAELQISKFQSIL